MKAPVPGLNKQAFILHTPGLLFKAPEISGAARAAFQGSTLARLSDDRFNER
jgi:hypothetical protein